ncbi:zinc-binding alcohol dehydrogenase family protein [Amnibacterium kyonggiense]|uniref:alcohol dehydrogenase n=1 Tax=Amnibacterium kyonggiense TaxID=595671 RepID=A0A4R7FKH2_9MICO|nr:zinc-binding alcohol dehydrogenase family protein [Amnibacterium kyonggiense]TDS76871.1 propanol-preferring alcohol dehydrogenase [Amnibacterium kyonggiense]
MPAAAWTAPGHDGVLERTERELGPIAPDAVRVRVEACGVCRTDLHVVDGDLPPRLPAVVPGHQVVGVVVDRGGAARRFALGDRVGIAWLRGTCGVCAWCRSGRENLCPRATFTGWDADGGFTAETDVPEAFAYRLPADADPVATAPLLCAGIIGFRALQRAALPPGGRLAVLGFGSSASITAQLARAAGAEVVVITRGGGNRALAASMGFAVTAGERDLPDRGVDAAIVFAPAGDLVPVALEATLPGGTVVLAGIHMSPVPPLDYDRHLFRERDLRSVTANTRADGMHLLRIATRLGIGPTTTTYGFEDAPRALDDLRSGRAAGSLVLLGPGA